MHASEREQYRAAIHGDREEFEMIIRTHSRTLFAIAYGEANAPADISIQVYSQGNIVSHQSGPLTTLRRALAQSAGAIMWSARMIGVAIAFSHRG